MHRNKAQTAGAAAAAPPQHSAGMRPGARHFVSAKAVGSFVPRLTRPAFERYGFSAATLITDWAVIVGADVAAYTRPERLKWPRRTEVAPGERDEAASGRPGATLMLAVEPGRGLDVQYRGAQLIERINAYFGYRAVSDIRLLQTPVRPADETVRVAAPSERTGSSGEAAKPRAELAGIADQGLRAALERMAAGLGARSRGLVPAT